MKEPGQQAAKRIQTALETFILEPEGLTAHLARVLLIALKARSVDFDQIRSSCGEDAEDIVLLGWEWRLLLPVRSVRCAEWDDRILSVSSGEMYEMLNIVGKMVAIAMRTGQWKPDQALASLFYHMEDPDWIRIPELFRRMDIDSVRNLVSGSQIHTICQGPGLGSRVDNLIASLKAAGVMSPRLGELARMVKSNSPLYELNPSLCAGQ